MNAKLHPLLIALALFASVRHATAQATAFTYQGRLNNSGSPASGLYDFRFRLDADPVGNTILATVSTNAIPATNGLFVTTIDFGSGWFNGSNYWLEVDVRTNGGVSYTQLNPFQALTPTPYAVFATTASNVSGTVAAGQISGAVLSANFSGTYGNAVTLNNAGNSFTGSFTGNGANVTNVNATTLNGLHATNFWQTGGNSGTTAGLNYLGTTDPQPLEIHINGQRAFRLEPNVTNCDPNVIAGSPLNYVLPGVEGATISGGGATNAYGAYSNSVTANFGTIGGGEINIAGGGPGATVGGGFDNNASSSYATVGGGFENYASGIGDVIGGGGYSTDPTLYPNGNSAGGADSVVAGGVSNHATDDGAVVGGGMHNFAENYAATVGGGFLNRAVNALDTVPGGEQNEASGGNSFAAGTQSLASGEYSFALGLEAQATNQGAFVWADSEGIPFASTTNDQFLIRAQGGVGINTNNPNGNALLVNGNTWVNGAFAGTSVNVDPANQNIGNDYTNALTFGLYSGEGIASKRIGVNPYDLEFFTGFVNRMTIFNNGNVGIGTTNPLASLDIVSSYNPQLRLVQTANDYARIRFAATNLPTWDLAVGANVMNFFVNGIGNIMTLETNGNLYCAGTVYSKGVALTSDRNAKENFAALDSQAVLAKVTALPVTEWNYKSDDPAQRHIGPMAQDFQAAFQLSADDKHISVVDEGGVALAAIQGLNLKLEAETKEKDAEIQALKQSVSDLKRLVQSLATQK